MKIIKRQASIIVLIASLTTVCFSGGQERSNVPKTPVIDQNVAIDYGSIFDKYDSKRSVKSRNESLKGGAEFLRSSKRKVNEA